MNDEKKGVLLRFQVIFVLILVFEIELREPFQTICLVLPILLNDEISFLTINQLIDQVSVSVAIFEML